MVLSKRWLENSSMLEFFHVHHRRELAVVKTLLADNALVDKKEIGCGSSFDLEDEGDLS